MVTKTVKHKKLFAWNTVFDYTVEGGLLQVWFFPDPETQIKVELTQESTDALKAVRNQIISWMENEISLEGAVVERWEKQLVSYPEKQVIEFVQVFP